MWAGVSGGVVGVLCAVLTGVCVYVYVLCGVWRVLSRKQGGCQVVCCKCLVCARRPPVRAAVFFVVLCADWQPVVQCA